jgi:hypothetical protein
MRCNTTEPHSDKRDGIKNENMLSDRRGRSGLSATESSNMPGASDNINGSKEVCERQLSGIQEYPYESHTDPGGTHVPSQPQESPSPTTQTGDDTQTMPQL